MTETPSEQSAGLQALTRQPLGHSLLQHRSAWWRWRTCSTVGRCSSGRFRSTYNVEVALIQVTFTVFVLLETWLVPFEGWLVDKFGPQTPGYAGRGPGGTRVGMEAERPRPSTALYFSYAIAGLGAGIVYGTAHRKRAEVVPGSSRTCGRSNSCRLRSWVCLHRRTVANMINPRGSLLVPATSTRSSVGNHSGGSGGASCAVL